MPIAPLHLPDSVAPSLEKTVRVGSERRKDENMFVWETTTNSSLNMNIDAIHVRDIRIFDQTFWGLQSFAIELEMNDTLSVEFEAPSRCIDHLDKSCALWTLSVKVYKMCKVDKG